MIYRTLISAETCAAHLDDPAWCIVDCRHRLGDAEAGRALYREAHIAGALFADLDTDLAGPPGGDGGRHPLPTVEAMRETFGRLGIGPSTQVVVYDDMGGQFAARLWWMLRYLGHDAVAVLDGGWQRWLALALPTASGDETTTPTTFVGESHPAMLASFDEVAEGDGLLVDARAPARYRGEVEPIDRVPGHIPGAVNRPTSDNLTDEQRFRSSDELQATWDDLLGDTAPDEVIVYCGSGVTACHNILAMEHAGLSGARLFPPSWSGWSSDPARPVAVGE